MEGLGLVVFLGFSGTHWGNIRVYSACMGIMEKKMKTTIMANIYIYIWGILFRGLVFGVVAVDWYQG